MRVLGILLALLACGVALFLVLARSRGEPRDARRADEPRPSGGEARVGDERVAALERRVDELALTVSALRDELARATSSRSAPEAPAAPLASAPGPGGDERTPAWYLEQYVASFIQGGAGSEYFRLAVEAFAPALLREIGALVLDPDANQTLRLRLVEMLGDGRFRASPAALDLCLKLLPARGADAVVEAALVALGRIGLAETARVLEGALWSIESLPNRRRAVETLVALAGEGANAALGRLWSRALDDAERAFLLGQLVPNEGSDSLALFEQGSYASQPVRLAGAQAIEVFRFPAFPAFVASWIAREPDAEVRAALGAAQATLAEAPRWGAERAVGPPDAESLNDDPNAWASAQADMGEQWLELDYDPPLRASGARIFEVCVPGALTALVALDERGVRHELWSGIDPTASPGVFELAFAPTEFRVRTLRLVLDTNRRSGWSEIDAVELVGPDGRAWARSARASSSYGERRRARAKGANFEMVFR